MAIDAQTIMYGAVATIIALVLMNKLGLMETV